MALLSSRTCTGFARQPNAVAPSHLQAPRRCNVTALPVSSNVSQAGVQPRRCVQRSSRKALRTIAQAATQEEFLVKSEQLSTCGRKLTVTVPASTVKQCFTATVENLRKVVGRLPGFRDDKVPLPIIISHCGGQEAFKSTCVEELLFKTMEAVMPNIKESVVPNSEKVASDPKALIAAFDPAKPLTIELEYETVPPVVWRKSYRDIEVTIRDTGDIQTDTAATEDLIRQYRKEKGIQRVAGRGIAMGDCAMMDMKMTPVGSKLPLPGLTSTRYVFDTEVDTLSLFPHMEGAKVGEMRKFKITLPDDYSVELWQGMELDAEIKVKEVFEWELPEFNDEFVKAHYPKFSSAEEMKQSLVATTAMERIKQLDETLADAVVQAVCNVVELADIPETLVMEMAETQYRARLIKMIEDRVASREEVESYATEEMMAEFAAKKRDELVDLVKYNIAVDEVWATEGLKLDEEELAAEVKLRAGQYKQQKVEYDEQMLRDQVIDTLKHIKVTEWLKDNVKRTVVPWNAPA